MDGLVDVVSAWIASERERAERERDVGRAWLTVMVEGDPDKIGTMITELADRSASLDYDVIEKLRASAPRLHARGHQSVVQGNRTPAVQPRLRVRMHLR